MNRRRQFLADQRGFTMASIMLSMMILGLFAVGGWAAAKGDIPLARSDQDRKRAFEAAEAGIQWYTYQLEKNTNYWTYCATAGKVAQGINNKGSRTSWRALPNSQAEFAIELLPVAGKTCSTTDPSGTMLDGGILRVRSTGRANGHERQMVAQYRRSSFLDYIYFTKWETLPPAAYTKFGQSPTTAAQNCDTQRSLRPSMCIAIQFPSGDAIRGPMHTEDDSLLVCGTPTFGRNATDKVEVARATGAASAFKQNGNGCSGSVNLAGTLSAPSKSLDLPDDNQALSKVADYSFTGNTCLQFNGDKMTVYPNQTRWGQAAGSGFPDYRLQIGCTGTPTTYSLSTDTVVWVGAGAGCTGGYAYYQKYDDPSTCGHVAVSGSYSTNVTIGAANDVIVTGNITRSGDAMMGLVAGKFVRVYHPVNPYNRDGSNNCTTNLLSSPAVTEIDAALLATTGSFITDNWDCGNPLGTLTVKGAITQYWRGAVGTGSAASPASGYLKDYQYDDRLKYREPPQFLDPVTSSWNLLRESEQAPVLTG
jgi:type II secretory pathway pseudopilin PulG